MNLCDALKAEFLAPVAQTPPETPDDFLAALDVLGPTPRAAMFFAGTSDKKSKAYKAARRRVERYRAVRTGAKEVRRPDPRDRARLFAEATRVFEGSQKILQGGPVTIDGAVQVSRDTRQRRLHSTLTALTRQQLAALLALNRCDEAIDLFTTAFMEGSRWVGGSPPRWIEVDDLSA